MILCDTGPLVGAPSGVFVVAADLLAETVWLGNLRQHPGEQHLLGKAAFPRYSAHRARLALQLPRKY